MGDFNHSGVCWKDHTAGHQQSKRFLECLGDNFLLQVVKQPTREGAVVDLVLINKEGPASDVKVIGRLGHVYLLFHAYYKVLCSSFLGGMA